MDTKNIREYIKRIKYYVENIKYIDEELTRYYKEEPTKLTTLIGYVKTRTYQIKKKDINSVIRRAIYHRPIIGNYKYLFRKIDENLNVNYKKRIRYIQDPCKRAGVMKKILI